MIRNFEEHHWHPVPGSAVVSADGQNAAMMERCCSCHTRRGINLSRINPDIDTAVPMPCGDIRLLRKPGKMHLVYAPAATVTITECMYSGKEECPGDSP